MSRVVISRSSNYTLEEELMDSGPNGSRWEISFIYNPLMFQRMQPLVLFQHDSRESDRSTRMHEEIAWVRQHLSDLGKGLS